MGEHWYTQTGKPRYNARIKEARDNLYLPSITSVDKIISNPGLEIWKQQQVLSCALTLSRGVDETDKEFISRVMSDSKQQARKAAKLGNVIHKLAERYISGKPLFYHGQREDVWKIFFHLKNWIDENIQTGQPEIILVNEKEGYAGKADLVGTDWDNRKTLIDFKTTALTPDHIKKGGDIKAAKIYPSWGRQLAALNRIAAAGNVLSVIISTNIDFLGVWVYKWNPIALESAYGEFLSALSIFKIQKKL